MSSRGHRSGGKSNPVVVQVPDLEMDEEEEEESENEDVQELTDSDSDISVEALSMFARGEEHGDSSDESLLDLDEFAECNLNETTVMLHEMIDTCHDLEEKQGFQPLEDKILRNQVKQSAKLLEAQFMPDCKILEINKTMFRRPTTASTVGPEDTPATKDQELSEEDDDDDESTPPPDRNKNKNKTGGSTSRRAGKSTSAARKRPKKKIQSKITEKQQSSAESMKPSLMFLAYKHTNMCAHLMQKRTETMGLEESRISVDGYISGLNSLAEAAIAANINEETSMDQHIYKLVSGIWKTAPSIITVLGSFDHKEYLAKVNVVVEKPAKKVVQRRQKQFDPDSLVATQTEVNISKEDSTAKSKANDEVVKAFRKSFIGFTAGSGKESVNIHEFTLNTDSVRESLNNMFGVAFGVRDGTIALKLEDNQLKIAPTKAPPREEDNMSNRRQCILSMSAATIRKLQEIAQGETVIKAQVGQSTSRT